MLVNDDQKAIALEILGWDLAKIGWHAQEPIASAFEFSGNSARKSVIDKAIAFLSIEDTRIRQALCDSDAVRSEISAAGSITCAVCDALAATGGFPVPVASIANALISLDIHRYCKS